MKMGGNTRSSKNSYDIIFKQKVNACAEKDDKEELESNEVVIKDKTD